MWISKGRVMTGVGALSIAISAATVAWADTGATVRIQALAGGTSALAVKTMQLLNLGEKYGFKAEYQYVNAAASNQNFLQDLSDVDFDSSISDVAISNSKQYDVRSVMPESINHAKIIAAKDSPYNSMAELKGKKIGWYSSDSTGSITVASLLAKKNIDFYNDYQFVKSSPAALVKLLAAGEVDAILDFQPWVSWAETQVKGGIKTIYDPNVQWREETGGVLWMTGVTVKKKWIDSNPKLLNSVMEAWCEAADYINKNSDKVLSDAGIQEVLKPLDEKGRAVFAGWLKEAEPFRCHWTDELMKNGRQFLEMVNGDRKILDHIPPNIYLGQ